MIRAALKKAARVFADTLEDNGADDGRISEIRGRAAAVSHIDRETLGAHYSADVTLLLDEVDRLRYEKDRTAR